MTSRKCPNPRTKTHASLMRKTRSATCLKQHVEGDAIVTLRVDLVAFNAFFPSAVFLFTTNHAVYLKPKHSIRGFTVIYNLSTI